MKKVKNMEQIKKNFMLVFSVVLASAVGVAVGIFLSGGIKNNDSDDDKNNNSSTDTYSIDYVLDFMQVYHLDVVESSCKSIKDMNKLSNQVKLWMAYQYLNNSDTYDFQTGVSDNVFDKYMLKVFGNKVRVKHENILHNDKIVYEYENNMYKENEKYVLEDYIVPIIDKVVDFNSKYELIITRAYAWKSEISSTNAKVYGSYEDALRHKNVIYEGEIDKNFEQKYYEKLKKKMVKQKYIFARSIDNLVLVGYELIK